MSEGYAKLYSDIVDSSIWSEDASTCKVWVTLLALANADGFVRGSPGWLSWKCRVTLEVCEGALLKFESPDPESRTPDNEGRRIKKVDKGWIVLNYAFFRNNRSRFDTDGSGERAGYVYYARDGDQIKIGYSLNPWSRVNELKTARPGLQLVGIEKGSVATEMIRHEQFKEFRIEREWFSISDAITLHLKALGVNSAPLVANDSSQKRSDGSATPASASVPESSSVREGGTVGRGKGFQKPTKEQVELQAAKIGLAAGEVEKFINHYEANGWKVGGKTKMVSWTHSLSNWKLNNEQGTFGGMAHAQGQRPLSLFDMKTIIAAKETQAQDLKNRHCSEGPINNTWNSEESRLKFKALRAEIKEMTGKIAAMG